MGLIRIKGFPPAEVLPKVPSEIIGVVVGKVWGVNPKGLVSCYFNFLSYSLTFWNYPLCKISIYRSSNLSNNGKILSLRSLDYGLSCMVGKYYSLLTFGF